MVRRSRGAQLAGGTITGSPHVCGLFDGPRDAADTLRPFILEGLRQGDRVVHITGQREPYLDPLALGDAITEPMASGQFLVLGWGESYLADGQFASSKMVSYVRSELRHGRALGFSATRLVGDMEWATDDSSLDDLVLYESQVGALFGRRDAVVCSYDVGRHSATVIAAVLGVHENSIVGGRLRNHNGSGRGTPRERILSAASELFREGGIQATGVDALIEAAGVAKATFYRQFRSKDALIVAWLRDPRTRWLDRVRARAEAGASSPDEVLERFFDAVGDWLEETDLHGCAYLNTAVEISDPTHPALQVIRDFLDEVEAYVRDQVAAAGYRDPAILAKELQAVLAGGIMLAVARQDREAFDAAVKPAARRLLESSRPKG